MIDQVISHYRITAKLGAGGMGEVYRATDTKLGRDVALKVLPQGFASDQQRMARFQREAQMLASLNHPNIATIHGIEQTESTHALVMEVVEGPTLAEQIARGPLPPGEALRLARQITEALEYAHDRGIVHRDLKPANIKLTPDGNVKLLDFGLAKAMADDVAASSSGVDFSPTMSFAATRAGLILGTAAYMAPEQAKGKAVDRRADVWAFGAVLYEMLTGQRAFHGEDASEILASVIKSDPDWSALPESTPPHIAKLLRRCLEKDARRRLQAIGEARIQIEEVMADSSATTAVMSAVTTEHTPAWRRALPWTLAAVMTVAFVIAMVALLRSPAAPDPDVVRFEVALDPLRIPGALAGSRVAISPDGRRFVVVGQQGSADRKLYLHSMETAGFTAMPGTDNATQPFFSSDGQWVGFSVTGKLKKVPLAGGVPVTLCDLRSQSTPAIWMDNGTIVFRETGGLFRIPEGGGTPEIIPDPEGEKLGPFVWISPLPGSRALLGVSGRAQGGFEVSVLDLETGKRRPIIENASWPRYLATGHLLFAQYVTDQSTRGFSGGLLAIPFDLKRLERTGSPFPVAEDVRVGSGGAGFYDVSTNGTLVSVPGSGGSLPERSLAWTDRTGKPQVLPAPKHNYMDIRISPDGARVVASLQESSSDIYTYDLRRGTLQRLTFDGSNVAPVFTPVDGSRIAYASTSGGVVHNLWWKPFDGSGAAERLTTSEQRHTPASFSPDGKLLLFTESGVTTRNDLFVLPLEGERKPQVFLKTPFSESSGRFSPDGKWISYSSDESGLNEIYVQPYPGPGGKWQISQGGGTSSVWSRDGKRLYFLAPNETLMAVDVTTQPSFTPGTPRVVVEGLDLRSAFSTNYDVAADGRILFAPQIEARQEERPDNVRVVLNFLTEVRRRLPASK